MLVSRPQEDRLVQLSTLPCCPALPRLSALRSRSAAGRMRSPWAPPAGRSLAPRAPQTVSVNEASQCATGRVTEN